MARKRQRSRSGGRNPVATMRREAAQLDPAAAVERIVEDLQNMQVIATAIAAVCPADSGAVAVAIRRLLDACCDVGRRKWRLAGSPGDGTDDAWLTWLLEQASTEGGGERVDGDAESATA